MARHHRLVARTARLFWGITRPRTIGVRALLLDEHDRVALVRHTYTPYWYLPGGGVKKGEGTGDALRRELREEVAVTDLSLERVLGVYHSRAEAKDDHIIIFVARTRSRGEELPAADAIEVAEARWFPLDEIPASVSPATMRRIAEYRSGATGAGSW